MASEGNLETGKSGIDATSVAVADSGTSSTVNQTNSNAASAETTGLGAVIAQGPFELSVPFSFNTTFLGQPVAIAVNNTLSAEGGQSVDQSNVNLQGLFATSVASAGDVTVQGSGNIKSDESGVDAKSIAKSSAAAGSTVTQSNTNSLQASTEGAAALIFQDQDVEQLNLNGQLVAATSLAFSGDVTVSNEGKIKAKEDGIEAESKANAGASITNHVDQTNRNGPPPTPEGAEPIVTGSTLGLGALLTQNQTVGQINLNGDLIVATSVADSGDVTVTDKGKIKANGDGINAESDAKAYAGTDNTVDQHNINALSGSTDSLSLILQTQFGLQANVNLDAGVATATALSDHVTVDHTGSVKAGEDGIKAISAAEAGAQVAQTANQTNENDLDADGALALQIQGMIQANVNVQEGLAVSTAVAEDVTVTQDGKVAAGEDGIKAISSADAKAAVHQTADQTNDNSATIGLVPAEGDLGSVIGGVIGDVALPGEIPVSGLAAGIQVQLAAQINANVQDGEAIATAVSDSVYVSSTDDPAGGNGIVAKSKADAGAAVIQDAHQHNINSASIDLPADGFGIGVQLQGIIQANINSQDGDAIATAVSKDVTVNQDGSLEAGKTGIDAASKAKARAAVVQTADQSNSNTATIAPAASDEPVQASDGIALQLQGFLQANVNEQEGLAISTAFSDDVTVTQAGDFSAGKDGIVAKSSAEADAFVVQTANQSNENTASATLGGAQVGC